MPEWIGAMAQLVIAAGMIIGAVGAIISWQMRIVHQRIDKNRRLLEENTRETHAIAVTVASIDAKAESQDDRIDKLERRVFNGRGGQRA